MKEFNPNWSGTFVAPANDPIWQKLVEVYNKYQQTCLTFSYNDCTIALCRKHLCLIMELKHG